MLQILQLCILDFYIFVSLLKIVTFGKFTLYPHPNCCFLIEGLKSVKKAVFHKCGYMEDDAVRQLGFLKDTLEDLQISSCGNVTDEGILTLVQMKYVGNRNND